MPGAVNVRISIPRHLSQDVDQPCHLIEQAQLNTLQRCDKNWGMKNRWKGFKKYWNSCTFINNFFRSCDNFVCLDHPSELGNSVLRRKLFYHSRSNFQNVLIQLSNKRGIRPLIWGFILRFLRANKRQCDPTLSHQTSSRGAIKFFAQI